MEKFSFLDQKLHLYPEPALYWAEARTLIVADVHLGKAAAFRAAGIPLPAGTTGDNLDRLSAALARSGAERLLILGDWLHARRGRTDAVLSQVSAWRRQHRELAIDLVLGNHDEHAGRPPDEWDIRCIDELVESPFVWRHESREAAAGYVIAGHVHPAVVLRGRGEHLTLPCFYFGRDYGLLPAFGDFTGFGVIRPRAGEAVFVLVEGEILPFGD